MVDGRTDDRINLGGTRFFSGKIEAQIERLPSVSRAAAMRVYAPDGAEALGIAIQSGPDFDREYPQKTLKRAIHGVGEIFVKSVENLPTDQQGNLDRSALEKAWPDIPDAAAKN